MIYVKNAFFSINSIGCIRKYLSLDPRKRLVNALVISHLDYCNSLPYDLHSNKLAKLQRVQNTAAWLILGARRFDQITPLPHWLPLPARLEFTILLLTYESLHNQSPFYLRELLKFRNPSRTLRSSIKSLLQNSNRLNTLYYGLPSLLLNSGTLYLNILSQPCLCQLLKWHLKLTFLVATSFTTNDTFAVQLF